MTSIDKLQISNIRSFGPSSRESPNIIEFYKPLTIIVGHNGAGKTTVIECLKYVTTGDVPPNSDKGQAFVRDPRVAGVSEIKAQIRLRFRNLKGAPVVVNRILQVLQKPNSKLEYKTKEGTIQLIRNGEKVSQSHRCADIDQFIPTYMGVSKAILNNVIFCHQEESNWPLLEKAKVKQKFDDIFCATRYNKALEEIKNLRKSHAQSAREAKLKLETIQVKKSTAEKLHGEVSAIEKRIQRYDEKLQSIESKREQVNGILRRSEALEEEARKALMDIRSLQTEESTLKAQLQSLKSELNDDLKETYEQLITLRDGFQQELAAAEKQLQALKEKRSTVAASHAALTQTVSKEEHAIASEKVRVESLLKTSRACDQAIVRFAQEHGLGDSFFTGPFSTEDRGRFCQEMTALLRTAEHALDQARSQARKNMGDLDSRAGTLRYELASVKASTKAAAEEETSCDRQIAQLSKEIQESKELLATMDDLELSAATLEAEISQLRTQVDGISGESLQALREELAGVEKEKSALNDQMQAIHQADAFATQLSALEPRLEAARSKYKGSFGAVVDSVGEQVGPASNCIDLQAKADAVLEMKKLQLVPLVAALEAVTREEAQLSGQLEAAQRRLTEAKANSTLAPAVSDEFPALYEAAKKRVDKVKGEISMAKAATVIYNRFTEESRSSHSCPLCKREMEADPHSAFLADLEKTVAAVPKSLEKLERTLERALAKVAQLEKEKGDWEKIEQMKARVVQEDLAVKEVMTAHRAAQEKISESKAAVSSMERETSVLASAVARLDGVRRDHDEMKRLQIEKQKLQEAIKSSSCSMSLADAQDRLRALTEKQRSLSGAAEEHRQIAAKAHKLLTEKLECLNVVKGKLLKAGTSSSTVESLRGKIKELEATALQAKEKKQNAKKRQASLEEELVLMEAEVASARKRYDQEEKVLQEKKDNIQRQSVTLNTSIARLMHQPSANEAAKELKQREAALTEQRKQLADMADSLTSLTKRQDDIEEKLRSREKRKRHIGDCIRCRELENQISAVRKRAGELQDKQKERSGKRPEDILQEKEKAIAAQKKLQSNVDKLQAGLDIFKNEMQKKKREGRDYDGIEEEYKKRLIELNTVQMVCDDLDKYHRVLDKALMDYHTMKIEEINKSLKELWQTTYKGTDIDSIEIRADHEGNRSRPSYNYRVVMVKGDTELNMRGRCSAGQRVLASLVIRLALAEALGVNCGIIALDEPTTNLDRANVESFASALVNLIDARRRQTNFQLIVITHDEEFVQLLGRSDNADFYWRVAKDSNQHSTLTKCDISELA